MMRRMPRPQDTTPYKCESCRITLIGKGDLSGWKPVNMGDRMAWFCNKTACQIAADDAVGKARIQRAQDIHGQLAEATGGKPVVHTMPTLTSGADPAELERKLIEMGVQKDGAYAERNRCVIGLCKLAMALGFQAGIGEHDPDDESWEDEWRTVVFIDLPAGQVSWHIHDSERGLFEFLPPYVGSWDGHDTATKYHRVMFPGVRETRAQDSGVVVGESEGQSTAPEPQSEVTESGDLEATVTEAPGSEASIAEEGRPDEAEGTAVEPKADPVGRPTAKFGKRLIGWIQENGWDDEPILLTPSAYPSLKLDKIEPEIMRDGLNGFFVGAGLELDTIDRVVIEGQFVGLRFTLKGIDKRSA